MNIIFVIFNAIFLFAIMQFFGSTIYSTESGVKEYSAISFSKKDDDHSFGSNLILNIILPSVYILILSDFLYRYFNGKFISVVFFIIPAYFLFRILFVVFILNRTRLININFQALNLLSSSLVGYILFKNVILKTENIFISFDEFKNEMWLLIILYCYNLFRNKLNQILTQDKIVNNNLKLTYIKSKYEKYKKKYQFEELTNEHPYVQCFFYSVMILEDFNRPKFYREIEKFLFKIRKKRMTLGIMQVSTEELITDKESCKLALTLIKRSYSEYIDKYNNDNEKKYDLGDVFETNETPYLIRDIARNYNNSSSYEDELVKVFNVICRYENYAIQLEEY